MARKKYNTLNVYGYREQEDFDPIDISKSSEDPVQDLAISKIYEKVVQNTTLITQIQSGLTENYSTTEEVEEMIAEALSVSTSGLSDSAFTDAYFDFDNKDIVFKNVNGAEVARVHLPSSITGDVPTGKGLDKDDEGNVIIKLDASSPETNQFLSVTDNGLSISGITQYVEDSNPWKAPSAEEAASGVLTEIRDSDGNPIVQIKNDGEILFKVEDDFVSLNDIVAQITHEEY